MQEKLPPTDSRLRPDQRHLENGEFEMANSEKLRLEQRQRQVSCLPHTVFLKAPILLIEFHAPFQSYALCYIKGFA